MLTVDEALELVGRHVRPSLAARQTALADLLGLRLAESVASADDSPPFDKSMVDGFALRADDAAESLKILELVVAGEVPRRTVEPGTAVRVMTGAPIPEGADAVVKWEDCELADEQTVRHPAWRGQSRLKPGDCIVRRGSSFTAGQTLLAPGKRVTPLEIALLAEIGRATVAAVPRPTVGVLPTGDELVDASAAPGPGQIRNSNGPMLLAAVAAAGATPRDLGVARDDEADLRAKIAAGLACDVLLVSGGVSAGVRDLVPGILAELGVAQIFHKVSVKPGKPIWFGARVSSQRRTLVFGLPGNPVSTFVTFKLFVEPALAALAGAPFVPLSTSRAILSQPTKHRGERPTYHPCRWAGGAAAPHVEPLVEPLDWRGSADLAALTRADCLAVLPAGDYHLDRGAEVAVLPL